MGRKRIYTLNENYFNKIDTKNKAYIVGFIFADGGLFKNYLNIGIHSKDISVLNFIKTELNYNGKLYYIKEYVKLTISSKQIINDLNNIGIIENKTYLNDKLPNIPNEFFSSFLLGFFDGDGSIYKSSKTLEYEYTVNFTNNLKVLTLIKEKLLNLGISSSSIRKRYENEISCMLDIKGSINLTKIYNLFYGNPPSYYFERKLERFNSFKKGVLTMTKRYMSDETISIIKKLYLEGKKQFEISKQLNIKSPSVRCVIQRLRKQNLIK
jgi:hypothetical protein